MGHKLSPAGGWAVDAVMAESPAEEAGILQGERILEIGELHYVWGSFVRPEDGWQQSCVKSRRLLLLTGLTPAAQCLQGGALSATAAISAAAALQTWHIHSQGINFHKGSALQMATQHANMAHTLTGRQSP